MKVTAVIAECNPFHEGHQYILEQARLQTGCDALVVVLSGDFVQRGSAAILSKEVRVGNVLAAGADLVLELPLYYATGAADYFARGAISMIHGLGVVTDVCFGSESGDLGKMQAAAAFYQNESDEFRAMIQDLQKEGISYPDARMRAAKALGLDLPEGSNDILGTEYISAAMKIGANLNFHAIPRIPGKTASDHRALMLEGQRSHTVHNGFPYISNDDLSAALLYKLKSIQTLADISESSEAPFDASIVLEQFVDVNRDLANRIMNLLPQYVSFTQFCDLLKTRNLTYTRISRALLHILLDIRKDHMAEYEQAGLVGYARVLGFYEGTKVMHEIAARGSIQLITRLSIARTQLPSVFSRMLAEDLSASEYYDMVARSAAPALTGITEEDIQPIAEETKQIHIYRHL